MCQQLNDIALLNKSTHIRTTGRHLPYGITCHLTRVNAPRLSPAQPDKIGDWYSVNQPDIELEEFRRLLKTFLFA